MILSLCTRHGTSDRIDTTPTWGPADSYTHLSAFSLAREKCWRIWRAYLITTTGPPLSVRLPRLALRQAHIPPSATTMAGSFFPRFPLSRHGRSSCWREILNQEQQA